VGRLVRTSESKPVRVDLHKLLTDGDLGQNLPVGKGVRRSAAQMHTRLFWMSSGYVAGATSSWWVQRKVKRQAEKLLPQAIRNEVVGRVSAAGGRVVERTTTSPVVQQASKAWQRVRPADIDLTRSQEAPTLSIVDGGLSNEAGLARLRDRARRTRR
jgi:hypothetical protein